MIEHNLGWVTLALTLCLIYSPSKTNVFAEDCISLSINPVDVHAQESSSYNETFSSPTKCVETCRSFNFIIAAIEAAIHCYCFGEGAQGFDYTDIAKCNSVCGDGTVCGGKEEGYLSLFEVSTGKGNITFSITSSSPDEFFVGENQVIAVETSDDNERFYTIDWGDGSPLENNTSEHIYDVAGNFIITASLTDLPHIWYSAEVQVHSHPTAYDFNCSSVLLGEEVLCAAEADSQGFENTLECTLGATPLEFHISGEVISLHGRFRKDLAFTSLTKPGQFLHVISAAPLKQGGYITRVRANPETATGQIGLYAITPKCDGSSYCSTSNNCHSTCPVEEDMEFVCSSNFVPSRETCSDIYQASTAPLGTFSSSLLAVIDMTSTNLDYEVPEEIWIDTGSWIGFGCLDTDCATVAQVMAEKIPEETSAPIKRDSYYHADAELITPSPYVHYVQVVVRHHELGQVAPITKCESVDPIPKANVPTPYSAQTEEFVSQGSLDLTCTLKSTIPSAVSPLPPVTENYVCQQNISEPTFEEEIWIEHGKVTLFPITFAQGSPIFSKILIENDYFYDYHDGDGISEYILTLSLDYVAEGLHLLTGSSTNSLGHVLYENVIHVVPPVTNTWTLEVLCPCYNIEEGFTYKLDFPSAPHPPWNATVNSTFILLSTEQTFPKEIETLEDFGTYGAEGAAKALTISYLDTIVDAGTYNLTVILKNEVSSTTLLVEVEIEEGLRDITYTLLVDSDGELIPPMGVNSDILIGNFSNTIYPKARTGIPLKWKMRIEELNLEYETENIGSNFTHTFTEDGTYTITVSAYNTVQGWVNSTAKVFRVVSKIQGFQLEDDAIIKKPNEDKFFLATFYVFTPLACILVDYGDSSKYETFGYEPECNSFPGAIYKGPVQAPVSISHKYAEEGNYEVGAIAFDRHVSITQSLKIVIADLPCTMPVVAIVNSQKIAELAIENKRSLPFRVETTASYNCTTPKPVIRHWTITEIDPATDSSISDVPVELILPSWNFSQLAVPALFLEYGTYKISYVFEILASKVFELKRSDYTYFEIVKSPLEAAMLEGSPSIVTRGFGQKLDFKASTYSKDPDYPLESEMMNYTWWCRQVSPDEGVLKMTDGKPEVFNEQVVPPPLEAYRTYKGYLGGCFDHGSGTLSKRYKEFPLYTSSFVLDTAVFEITLRVSKYERSVYTSMRVEVVREPPPTVQIYCDPEICFKSSTGFIINPTNNILLSGLCLQDCGKRLTQLWTILSSNNEPVVAQSPCELSPPTDGSTCDPALSGTNTTTLTLHPPFFEANPNVEEFNIRITMTTEELKKGFTEVKIKKNQPPSSGYCALKRNFGYALVTDFEVNCDGWLDPEKIGLDFISYSYKNEEGLETSMASISSSYPLNLIFPVGNFSVEAMIVDSLKGITRYDLGEVVAILPTQEQIDSYNYNARIAYLSSTGDQASLAMTFVALSSIRDNADWLALDESVLRELSTSNLTDRVSSISTLNTDTLKTAYQTMNFVSMPQTKVGGNIVKQSVCGILTSEIGAVTVDTESRDTAILLLDRMSNQIDDIPVQSTTDLEEFLELTLDATHCLTVGIRDILNQTSEEKIPVPPTDKDSSLDWDYETDTNVGEEASTSLDEMLTKNVLEKTKQKSRDQIKLFNEINERISSLVRKRLVPGERRLASAEYGSSTLFWKLTEEDIKEGLVLLNKRSQAKVPPNFCPSKYVYENTDCKKIITFMFIEWPCTTYVYPKTAAFLASNSFVIDFRVYIDDKLVEIKDEDDPITIHIPRLGKDPRNQTIVNGSDHINPHVPFMYHQFIIDIPNSGYIVEIAPETDFPSNAVLLIQYEKLPLPSKFLKIEAFQNIDINDNGTYVMFVDSSENENRTGRFFAAFAILKNLNKLRNNPKDLSNDDFVANFDVRYSFSAYSCGCYYFDILNDAWLSGGMELVNFINGSTVCATNHTTSFSSSFLPLPNSLNFDYILANPGFIDNLSLYITLIIVFVLYIVMMIWGHWMDKKDIERRGVIPLPDNNQKDKYLYELKFFTGPHKEASTESNFNIIVSGDKAETEVRYLPPANKKLYRRFMANSFVMSTPRPLGTLNYLRVFHDNRGEPPFDSWQLELVVIRDLQTKEKFIFYTNTWLAFDRGEFTVDNIFTESKMDERSFSDHIYLRTNKETNQGHLWLSVFLRPVGSRYSRKERVTVCATFLCLAMLFSAMWYEVSQESPRNELFAIGPFIISTETLITAAFMIIIVFPFTFLISFVFQRARPKNLKRCRALDSIENQRTLQLKEQGLDEDEAGTISKVEIDESETPKPKDKCKKMCLPWFTRVIAWIVSLAAIVLGAFIVWSFGIMWGEIKTSKWLSSFFQGFFISLIFSQWLKVLVGACMSTIFKQDMTVEDIDCDEELPTLKKDETWANQKLLDTSYRKKVHRVEGVDFDDPFVSVLGKRLKKEREMKNVISSIAVYCIYLIVVYLIVSQRTDINGFYLKTHLQNTFIKEGHPSLDFASKIKTTDDFWRWSKSVILQEARAQRDYNNAPPYGLRGYMDDRANRMIGYPILRQIRSKRFNCFVPEPMDGLIERCSGLGGVTNEDTTNYCVGWRLNGTTPGDCNWDEYKYQSSDQLMTFTSLGKLNWYSGGGYVLRLTGVQSKLLERMEQLQKSQWIDKNTRAVILEFSVYNANVNLFAVCSVYAEFHEGGGVIPKWRFNPINLIKDGSTWDYFYIGLELIFVIGTAFFTINEIFKIKSEKLIYFSSYWNILEILTLIVSYIVIGLYLYRNSLTQEALNEFEVTWGNGYVRMDSAATIDEYFFYATAFIIFTSTLKLIKLLQFNNRMNVLALTIGHCWIDLKIFLIVFLIIFFAFSCLFFFIFTNHIEEFAEILSAIQTSFKMMMGKFNFEEMNRVNAYSSVLFFIFSVSNNMILINIMLSIIIQAFNEVTKDLENKENKLDLIDYVWTSFRQFVRLENLPRRHVDPKLTDKKETNPKTLIGGYDSDNLPDKVGQLLQYINNEYFDGRLDASTQKRLLQEKPTGIFVPRKLRGDNGVRRIISTDD